MDNRAQFHKEDFQVPGMELTLAIPCQALLIFDADFQLESFPLVQTALGIQRAIGLVMAHDADDPASASAPAETHASPGGIHAIPGFDYQATVILDLVLDHLSRMIMATSAQRGSTIST